VRVFCSPLDLYEGDFCMRAGFCMREREGSSRQQILYESGSPRGTGNSSLMATALKYRHAKPKHDLSPPSHPRPRPQLLLPVLSFLQGKQGATNIPPEITRFLTKLYSYTYRCYYGPRTKLYTRSQAKLLHTSYMTSQRPFYRISNM
jgi:hypothetical protein